MAETRIKGASVVVTMDAARREIAGGDVLIRDSVIAAVGCGLRTVGVEVAAGGAGADAMAAREALEIATLGGAQVLGRAFAGRWRWASGPKSPSGICWGSRRRAVGTRWQG